MRLLIFVLAATIAAYSALSAKPAPSTASPCLSQSDTAAIHQDILLRISTVDSAKLAAIGIPYPAAGGVTLVTDSVKCSQAIDSYNTHYLPGDTTLRVGSAYLFEFGPTTYVLVVDPSLYTFMDSSFGIIVTTVGL